MIKYTKIQRIVCKMIESNKSQINLRSLDILELQDIIKKKGVQDCDIINEDKVYNNGVIYIIQHNTISDLKYIGQTTETLGKRWKGHVTTSKQFDRMYYRLCFFLNYYNIENFSIRELKYFKNITKENLDAEEKKYIREMGTLNTRDANEEIALKITNEMRNELMNKFIVNNTELFNIYKLINSFTYDFKGNKLDFVINDKNKELIDEMLKSQLESNLIGMTINLVDTNQVQQESDGYFIDEKGAKKCLSESLKMIHININEDNIYFKKNVPYLKITKKILYDESIIDDFMKYIEYFNKHFQITNDKNDTYYSSDLIYGLQQFGEENELFDYYLLDNFSEIMQIYFNIINKTYKNVELDLNNLKIYGVKKTYPMSFKLIDTIYSTTINILTELEFSNKHDVDDLVSFMYDYDKKGNYNDDFDVYENKLEIEKISDCIEYIWEKMNIINFKYDYDYDYDDEEHEEDCGIKECYIDDQCRIMKDMHYSYDWNNIHNLNDENLHKLINLMNDKKNMFKIVDEKYIMLNDNI